MMAQFSLPSKRNAHEDLRTYAQLNEAERNQLYALKQAGFKKAAG